MSDHIPKKIIDAVSNEWGIRSDFGNIVDFEEHSHDWVVWKKTNTLMLGGNLLIVPKYDKNWFLIPSSYIASEESGVSWQYDVTIEDCKNPSREAAKILAEHLGISTLDAFKALKYTPVDLGIHMIDQPLRLIRDLKIYQVKLSLVRPNHRGGYQSDNIP